MAQVRTANIRTMRISKRQFILFYRVLAFAILILMCMGASVRLMGAGISCPDWPLCFGKIIPDFHVGVYFEFIHRAWAGIIAISFFTLSFFLLKSTFFTKKIKQAIILASAFLLLQIIMGGLTVLLLVKSIVVTAHLLLAIGFLSSVLWISFLLSETKIPIFGISIAQKRFIQFFAILLGAQITLGGLVASTFAGSVCVDWPLCNGQWVPTLQGAIGLQVMHRFVAYAVLILSIFCAAYLRKSFIKRNFFLLKGLILTQVILGILNLIFFLPPQLAILHHLTATLCWMVMLRILFLLRKIPTTRG